MSKECVEGGSRSYTVNSSAAHSAPEMVKNSAGRIGFMGITITPMKTLHLSAALFAASLAFAQTPDAPPDPVKIQAALDRANRTLQDWPAMKRYHDANATVAPPAPGEERVVFMGDSITDGWGKRYG